VLAKEVLRRAQTVMQSDPRGPAYLMLPREVLAEDWPEDRVRSHAGVQHQPVAASGVSDDALEPIVQGLLQAQRPLLITAYAGRNAQAVAAIDACASSTRCT